MAHLYEVELGDGQVHHVTTPHHHDDHDEDNFRRHLLDLIKQSAGALVSEVIIRVIYRGRR